MTNTKKNEYKERREWNDLLNEKKAFLKRRQQDEEARWFLREFLRKEEEYDDPAD